MSDEGLSLEDIFGEAAKQPIDKPKGVVPAEGITPEEAHGYLPAEKRGVLSAAPEDTAVQQALKYLGTGTTKMLSHIPGIGGDIGDLADFMVAYPEAWWKDVPTSEIIAKRKMPVADTALSKVREAIEPPSGADIQKYIFERTGEYRLIDLISNVPLQTLDFNVFWIDNNQNFNILQIPPYTTLTILWTFRNKNFYRESLQLKDNR